MSYGRLLQSTHAIVGATAMILTVRHEAPLAEAKTSIEILAPEGEVATFTVDVVDQQYELLKNGTMILPDVLSKDAGACKPTLPIVDS